MEQYLLAFITGLTTGGLSCLAVQGGLLASSLAHQVETDVLNQSVLPRKGFPKTTAIHRGEMAFPILLFLLAKLVAYTLLGGLLGWFGSFITFDPISRAILMIIIAVFMLGNGLRMLNVHPIFRYFTIQPPEFLRRFIRRKAKNNTNLAGPLFLGALTVLIPCGVTQAMMAVALGTGQAGQGAALLFAFTLGTSPVFFLAAFLTMRLGARLEKHFIQFVAVVLIILSLVSFNSALNLLGSPISISNLTLGLQPQGEGLGLETQSTVGEVLELNVENTGYFPAVLHAKAGQAITLNLVTDNTLSCARDFVIPALGYYELLPLSGTVSVNIPPQKAGSVMRFTCSMGMYTGEIVFSN